MTLFTAEAHGRPIVVFASPDRDAAHDLLEAQKGEFALLGACDEADELFLRDAFDDESDLWRRQVAVAVTDGELDSVEEADDYIVFLLPVSDPTDEFFDDEGEDALD